MTWIAHVALILLLTATGLDSLLIAALGLLVDRLPPGVPGCPA